jgi:hypothetical protein
MYCHHATRIQFVDELAGKMSDRRFAIIIDEAHNSTVGRNLMAIQNAVGGGLDNDVAVLGGLKVKELLLKLDELRVSARANSEEDFAIAYYDCGEDVLYDGLNQNNKFFG